MNKKLLLAALAISAGFTACVKDDPTRDPDELLHIEASAEAKDLHQLEIGDFKAVGSAISDPKAVTWFINGTEVAKGDTYSFSSKLPGEFELSVKVGEHSAKYKYAVRPRFDKGVFLLNEGVASTGTGTLTYLNADKKFALDSVFYRVNGKKLGNVSQDLAFANGKVYVISQNGAKNGGEAMLVIAESQSLKLLNTYDDQALLKIHPTHIVVIGERIYLRTDKGIYVGKESGGFKMIAGTEQAKKLRMTSVGERVFALTNDNKILMIQGEQIVATLAIAKGQVSGLALSDNGSLFVGYTNPNRVARISTDPRSFTIQEEQDVAADLADNWTSSSRIFAHSNSIYVANDRKIFIHDFSKKTTTLFTTVEYTPNNNALNTYYNGLGVDNSGNIYYAALEGWGVKYLNNATLIISPKNESILTKEKYNKFPAGFYNIPAVKAQ